MTCSSSLTAFSILAAQLAQSKSSSTKVFFHGYLRYHFNYCLIVYILSYNIKSGDCQSFRKNLTRKVLINQFNGDISDSGTAKVINRLNFDPARFWDDF